MANLESREYGVFSRAGLLKTPLNRIMDRNLFAQTLQIARFALKGGIAPSIGQPPINSNVLYQCSLYRHAMRDFLTHSGGNNHEDL